VCGVCTWRCLLRCVTPPERKGGDNVGKRPIVLRFAGVGPITRETNMSWKVEVVIDDSGEWEGDPQRFASEQEALAYGRDLELRCSAIREKRIVRSDDPVNHRWTSLGVRGARAIRS
jgi:hypothetical protein